MIFRRTAPAILAGLALAACSAGESDATPEAMPGSEDTSAAQPTASAEAQAIDALREEWVTHYNLHHPDMVADFYAEDAVVLAADQGVHEGKEAIAAWLTGTMENEPTATITTGETMVFGDQAVSMGTYEIEGTSPEGEAVEFSGYYMNALTRQEGEWLIGASVTNYDSPRPEGWTWGTMGEGEEPPAEEGTMTELVEAYETHWNLQHPDMVADLYTEDARAAFADGEMIEGRAAIEARMEEVLADGRTLDVHDVGTMELDENHRVDGGWYELKAGEDGEVVQAGAYMLLAELQDDGSWKIQRMITNARPMPAGEMP